MTVMNNDILLKINSLCEERNWSLYRLAKESDIPYSSLNNMFSRNTQPTIHTLEKMCLGLGITMSEFFDTPSVKNPNAFILSDDEKNIIEVYRSLDKTNQRLMNAYLHGLSQMLK